jgi:hypothetical protein
MRAETQNLAGLEHGRRIVQRCRERRAKRRHARLMSDRYRRVLVCWLRRTAEDAIDDDPIRRKHDVLLHDRAAAVRSDLLEIAALLYHAHDPDPEAIVLLHGLLADDRGDSPLYNRHIPASELDETLERIRTALETTATDPDDVEIETTPTQTPTPTAAGRVRGTARRWSSRRERRKLARLLRPRSRRALVERLRRAASDANDRDRKRAETDGLLRDRAAAVRTDLLEIAALLEHAHDPDPASAREIHQLLASRDSPLHDPDIHVSELHATLYYIRAGLI